MLGIYFVFLCHESFAEHAHFIHFSVCCGFNFFIFSMINEIIYAVVDILETSQLDASK